MNRHQAFWGLHQAGCFVVPNPCDAGCFAPLTGAALGAALGAAVDRILDLGAWGVLRSIEFTRQSERVCKRKRCLGLQRECLNPMKRDTLWVLRVVGGPAPRAPRNIYEQMKGFTDER